MWLEMMNYLDTQNLSSVVERQSLGRSGWAELLPKTSTKSIVSTHANTVCCCNTYRFPTECPSFRAQALSTVSYLEEKANLLFDCAWHSSIISVRVGRLLESAGSCRSD